MNVPPPPPSTPVYVRDCSEISVLIDIYGGDFFVAASACLSSHRGLPLSIWVSWVCMSVSMSVCLWVCVCVWLCVMESRTFRLNLPLISYWLPRTIQKTCAAIVLWLTCLVIRYAFAFVRFVLILSGELIECVSRPARTHVLFITTSVSSTSKP